MRSQFILAGFIGIVLGAATGVSSSVIYYRRRAALFANRVRCRTIAEEYLKNSVSSPLLEQVDFSPDRNSCVASTFAVYLGEYRYDVVDVVSNENLFSESCDDARGECGGGVNVKLYEQMQKAFKEAAR